MKKRKGNPFIIVAVILVIAAILTTINRDTGGEETVPSGTGGNAGTYGALGGPTGELPAPSVEETLSGVLADAAERVKPEDVTIEVYPETGRCNVTYTDTGSKWDETQFIRSNLTAYINFCKEAYTVDKITDVFFMIKTEMTDTKGNKSVETVVKIEMEKPAFDSYNWDGMEYKTGSFEQIKANCKVFDVHAGILSRVDTEKVYYAP